MHQTNGKFSESISFRYASGPWEPTVKIFKHLYFLNKKFNFRIRGIVPACDRYWTSLDFGAWRWPGQSCNLHSALVFLVGTDWALHVQSKQGIEKYFPTFVEALNDSIYSTKPTLREKINLGVSVQCSTVTCKNQIRGRRQNPLTTSSNTWKFIKLTSAVDSLIGNRWRRKKNTQLKVIVRTNFKTGSNQLVCFNCLRPGWMIICCPM